MPGINLTRDEAMERSRQLVAQTSHIHLDLTTGSETFRTKATITFRAKPGATSFIDAITERIHSINLNGQQLDPATHADEFRIQLPGLKSENVLEIDADFRYSSTGEGLHRFVDPVDGEVYLYTQFEVPDARRVFPTFEQPDLKQAFSFTVDAPAHWTVISNQPTPKPQPLPAEHAAETDTDVARWVFPPTPRISSYITAIVAGPYEGTTDVYRAEDGRTVPLGVYSRASLAKYVDADNLFATTKAGFKFFEEQFGTPYPFTKYDQIFVPDFNAGAMENAGCVTILEDYVFRSKVTGALRERRDITVLHELAHMWFGDLVTMRWWDDLWLNESFAEFMSHLCAVETGVSPHAWTTFAASEKTWAYAQDQLPTTHPITADMVDLDAVNANFDGITYAKGAAVLRQLVAWVGQESFMEGVRGYLAENAWGNAELKDLLGHLEKASGRDLSGWSQQWLETCGVNTLSVDYDIDEDGYLTDFTVTQTACDEHPHLRKQHIKVAFYTFDGSNKLDRDLVLDVDIDGETTVVDQAQRVPTPDLVLLNHGDLGFAKIRLDSTSLETVIQHLSGLEDPLDRVVVWSALWDATRDGVLPATTFVDTVLTHLPAETDATLANLLLRQLEYALKHYVRPAKAETMLQRAGNVLWGAAQEAASGSDMQFQLVNVFARLANSDVQLGIIEDLRSGETSLSGLEIDQDLSWNLLISLAAGGRIGEAEIDAEHAKDTSANGAISAHTAKAALPTREAKQEAWDAMVNEQSLTNTLQRAVIQGFNRCQDDQLLAPYAELYFENLASMWDDASYEMSQRLVTGLYPYFAATTATLEATTHAIETLAADKPGLKRPLLEARDGLERIIAARKADEAANPAKGTS